MEKRPKKTLARTLRCGRACAKSLLVIALFVPALIAAHAPFRSSAEHHAARNAHVEKHNPPKELVKIFAILRSQRPEMAEAHAWWLAAVIHEESSKRHVDPLLVLALIRVESGFDADAVSPMGARGIMQIMPDTGKSLAAALAAENGFQPAAFTPESLHDPVLNLRLGIYYLHDLRKQFSDLAHVLTAYNFGPSHTQSRLENNLELSGDYASLVLAEYNGYRKIQPPMF
jgi:soluble lytic murein transglycosylase-like protein